MIFLSAGHNSKSKSIKSDPGAINKYGVKEGDLAIEFRDLVAKELSGKNIPFKMDSDEESLQMYLNRIHTGSGSVVIEYHFDAGPEEAEGSTSIVEEDADSVDKLFAKELLLSASNIMGTKSRGVKSERFTRHGKLALMREDGIICLFEICFITNEKDIMKYHARKHELAKIHAEIIARYESLI